MMRARVNAAALCAGTVAMLTGSAAAPPANATLTAVPGIKVGHYTMTLRPTGCTEIGRAHV